MRFSAVSSAVAAFAGLLSVAAPSAARGLEISDRCGMFVMPNDIAVFAARAISNHRALLSGVKTMSQLSSEEATELKVLVESYSTCSRRPLLVSANPDCQSAREGATREVQAAISAAADLNACLRKSDLADDCGSRFRSVKDLNGSVENAVSLVATACR
jgi:hypothetical protein